jgi:hypothetical protein
VVAGRHLAGQPIDSAQPPLPSVEYPYLLSLECSHQTVSKLVPKLGQVAALLGQSGLGFYPCVNLGLYRVVEVCHFVFGGIFPFGPLRRSKL